MLVDFSKAPDDVLGYFVDLRNDLDAFGMYLSSFYGVELHRRDSLIIFDEVQLYPSARPSSSWWLTGVTTTSRQARSDLHPRERQDILIPSEEESIRLNPMDFDELFLWALGRKATVHAHRGLVQEAQAAPRFAAQESHAAIP